MNYKVLSIALRNETPSTQSPRHLTTPMLTFNRNYFALATLIFITEVLIALYVKDRFIRPYIGDVLVVILIYCFIRSFMRLPVVPLAIGVLIFSFVVEALQYINIVDRLGLGHSKVARIVIGSSFSWADILSYTAGIAVIVIAELYWPKKQQA